MSFPVLADLIASCVMCEMQCMSIFLGLCFRKSLVTSYVFDLHPPLPSEPDPSIPSVTFITKNLQGISVGQLSLSH